MKKTKEQRRYELVAERYDPQMTAEALKELHKLIEIIVETEAGNRSLFVV